MDYKQQAKKDFSKFRKVVVWGLKSQYHTHRYIHAGFYCTLKKLEVPAVWVDYGKKSEAALAAGDLVISAFVEGRGVDSHYLPIKPGVYYCLHNYPEEICAQIGLKYLLRLQVYTNKAENSGQKWDEVTFFDAKTRTLFQPWGTNLLPEEFKQPIYNRHTRVFWIGSIWDNALRQGNVAEISEIRRALSRCDVRFTALRFVPDWLNIKLIRYSRLAPAVAGRWQAENNYLPCRMFKNISYGQLGFSNVKKFQDLFGDFNISAESIEGLVQKALALPKQDYLSIINGQQRIAAEHTYAHKLLNIFKALEIISRWL